MAWTCAACSGANPDGMRFCGLCGAPRAVAPGADPAVSMVADALRGLVLAPASLPADGAGQALRDERRLVTALFADISGFSELTNRLDPERLLEVIDPVVAALSNVVGRYDGIIEKFAGDALMALFGAPVAHDDDAVRALHVALDMHAELARMVPHLPIEAAGLRLHVGVNSGHGIGRVMGSEVRFDYGVLGDVVVLAQRLEAAAPTGETYVGETTYRLARKEFEFESLGELTVKGKLEPVPAWRLVGPRARRVAVPESDRHGRRLIGRDRELAEIVAFASRLDDGHGGAVFVLGEPGLGKTALCEATRGHVDDAGWTWLAARCLSYGGGLAYWPFADLFRSIFGVTDTTGETAVAALRSALGAIGLEETLPFIATLCGVLGAPGTDLTPQTFQTRLHESVRAVLGGLAASRPVVLHIDDLQWADGATVALLRDLLVAGVDSPLVVLASARLDGQAAVDALSARIPDSNLCLRLEPLAAESVRQIASQILGGPPAPPLVATLLEHTRGNPFFVEEVTRSLAERGSLIARGGEWHTPTGWSDEQVPVTVEGVVAARVDTLTEGDRADLEVLSVIGRRADLTLARAVASGIDASLPRLVAAGLVDHVADEPTRFVTFHHPLTQQVVYSRLLRRRRADLHRMVGETAETLLGTDDATVDLLARHFSLGEQPVKAFDYLLRAAHRAERLFANDQAITHLRQAIDLEEAATGSQAQRPELLLRCAQLEEVRGTYDRALVLYDEVWLETKDLRAAVGRASTLRKLGEYPRCLEAIREARAAHSALSAEETATLALVEGPVLVSLTGDVPRAIATLEDGLAALDGRNPLLAGRLLVQLAREEQYTGALDAAVDHAEHARRSFEDEEDLAELAVALRVLGGIYQEKAGEDDLPAFRRARETLDRGLRLARRVGNAEESAACLVNLGRVVWSLGMQEEALQYDRESIDAFGSVGLKAGAACGYCNLADHLGRLGRWDESLAAARQGLSVATEIGHELWASGALIGMVDALMALGEHDAAVTAAEEAVERAMASGQPDRLRNALDRAAAAHRRLGHDDTAEEYLRRRRALYPSTGS